MAKSVLITSAKGIVRINGGKFAWATDFSWQSTTSNHIIRGIDEIAPIEIAPTIIGVKGTCTVLRPILTGGLEGAEITAVQYRLPQQKYITIELVERTTGTSIFKCDQAMVSEQNWALMSRSVLKGSFSFDGTMWLNEADFA
jgi:hypothetical protein